MASIATLVVNLKAGTAQFQRDLRRGGQRIARGAESSFKRVARSAGLRLFLAERSPYILARVPGSGSVPGSAAAGWPTWPGRVR